VARCVVPGRESLDILRRIIGDAAPLLYAAREKDRGLDGRLCALVPFGRVRAELEARETEDEPWKASLPDPDAWKGDSFSEPAISEHELVPIPLGVIVRIPADRKHPDNLELETLSVLHSLLQKGTAEVVARLLCTLACPDRPLPDLLPFIRLDRERPARDHVPPTLHPKDEGHHDRRTHFVSYRGPEGSSDRSRSGVLARDR